MVHLEHNHKTSPTKSRLYRRNRQLSEHVKRQLEVNDIAGIPLHKSFNSAVVEAGGYENLTFVEKDCRNYIDQVRRLRLGEGDAVAIQAYFSKMQAFCPGFYFSVDLDEEYLLKNVFWADNRCRQAFKEFDDVVTFDTTYLTNRYDMSFAPFVGVNHHG
ncbi:protein FAR1-RELATED SEQUENCE 5-like [Diospyros lotus]|uniref:protein FAR1-RELATED SEQUENCE 5-like n=1 Tax=Diospyros lotus TaxID=55363 RepID=UPI00225216CC|nr:protein FAR1-RELATED SEQUENCE 5-like [Diospyros lotus]